MRHTYMPRQPRTEYLAAYYAANRSKIRAQQAAYYHADAPLSRLAKQVRKKEMAKKQARRILEDL